MAIKMTEREAAEFFAKIGRPVPLTKRQVHEAGTVAVQRALQARLQAHKLGVRAVGKALREGVA